MEIPEAEYVFQVTLPTGGFWGVVLKPWEERPRGAAEVLGEVQGRVSAIPAIQTFPILPPALPGGGGFPVEVVIASTAEASEILEFANKIQQEAAKSGLFAFPPLIDVKVDQPETGDRLRPREGGAAGAGSAVGGAGRRGGGGRQLREPLQRRRAAATRSSPRSCAPSAQPRAAPGDVRERPRRPAHLPRHHRHAEGLGGAPLAQPLPAAQRGEALRRGHPPPRRGAHASSRTRRGRSCRRATRSTTPASRASCGWRATSSSPPSSWR